MDKREVRLTTFSRSCHIVVDNTDDRGDEFLSLCRAELTRLDKKFSSYQSESLTSRLNQAAGTGAFVSADAEARSLFQFVDALSLESKQQFDPTTRALHDCYLEDGNLCAPSQQLQEKLQLVGWRNLEVTEEGAHLSKKGMLLDMNSCIRPYALDSVKKILQKNGATNALIDMDQDVATIGKQPDGSNWMVGVRFPQGPRTAIARLKLTHKGFAIRGNYEHRVTTNGERFGRALSPVDGQAIPGLLSVAVIAENCLTACSAANIARFKTELSGLKWLGNLGLPWMAIDRELNCHGPLAPRR